MRNTVLPKCPDNERIYGISQQGASLKIGIDARFVGPEGTGLGKYTEKLIANLAKVDKKNSYVIFLKKDNWDFLNLPQNFKKKLADVAWYSVAEQLKLPKIFKDANLDVLHVPHFNAPIFYKGRFIVTIHDLIHHQFSETSATTKNSISYRIKRIGYKKVIGNAIYKSHKIIVPSNYVKEQIIKSYQVDAGKIVVTYEAAEEEYQEISNFKFPISNLKRYGITTPFIIYIGNAYPHKNLNNLLEAFKLLTGNSLFSTLNLVIVCARDVFAQRLTAKVEQMGLLHKVVLTGYLKPQELSGIFKMTDAYVFPTLSEGFGIPGLNAMASGVPMVCSNIPTLKEIYGNAAVYFDPDNPGDIAEKIKKVLSDDRTRKDLVNKGHEQVNKYSWKKMAQETLSVYNNSA